MPATRTHQLTPALVLELWQTATGQKLSAEHRRSFLARNEVHALALLPRVAVRRAFERNRRLTETLPLARQLATTKASPATRRAIPGRSGKRELIKSAKNRELDPGPGPSGYYGGLGKCARCAPVFDPHPKRRCPSCDAPETTCRC